MDRVSLGVRVRASLGMFLEVSLEVSLEVYLEVSLEVSLEFSLEVSLEVYLMARPEDRQSWWSRSSRQEVNMTMPVSAHCTARTSLYLSQICQ